MTRDEKKYRKHLKKFVDEFVIAECRHRIMNDGAACYGINVGGSCIVIDARQTPKQYLDTVIHEVFHRFHPKASEDDIAFNASALAEILWRQGFRRMAK